MFTSHACNQYYIMRPISKKQWKPLNIFVIELFYTLNDEKIK